MSTFQLIKYTIFEVQIQNEFLTNNYKCFYIFKINIHWYIHTEICQFWLWSNNNNDNQYCKWPPMTFSKSSFTDYSCVKLSSCLFYSKFIFIARKEDSFKDKKYIARNFTSNIVIQSLLIWPWDTFLLFVMSLLRIKGKL